MKWVPDSWRDKNAPYQPRYRDPAHLSRVVSRISQYPPLVFTGEVDGLAARLAEAEGGKAFVLHGGDCVELFDDCMEASVLNKLKIILQMSVILTHALRVPVVRIGRIAGQYVKPRSKLTEGVDGHEVMTYRGDSVHGFEATPGSREPDPDRLLQGFFHSAVTLNYIRSLLDGGFADLHHPFKWKLHDIEKTDKWGEYREVVLRILDAIQFMEVFGGVNPEALYRTDFFISHEGLHLDYETALTRKDPNTGVYYNLGAHMLWIGDRTRNIDGGHVEYMRGIANPVGIKIGPDTTADELVPLVRRLNPRNLSGKLVCIPRLGAEQAARILPPLIGAVQAEKLHCTWCSDPMHGNTDLTEEGVKTRDFDRILGEIRAVSSVFTEFKVPFGGVHFELTGEDVTECTGGAVNVSREDLAKNYTSYCDPRLNYSQSLEMAFLIAKLLGRRRD